MTIENLTGTVLGAGTYIGPSSPDAASFIEISLSIPAKVVAGLQYVIAISYPDCDANPTSAWSFPGVAATPDPYPGGNGLAGLPWVGLSSACCGPFDFWFRTWVS